MRIRILPICLVALFLTISPGDVWSAPSSQSLYPRLDRPPVESAGKERDRQSAEALAAAQDAELFHRGYKLYADGSYAEASVTFFQFLSEQTPDVTDYEWAEFFFGLSLEQLGYSHAAVDTLTSVMTRKPNPKIVSYTLEVLELISRTMAFDSDLLINRGVCDQSYGFIDGEMADFVHYYQGEYDWEHGLFEWGDDHFKQIETESHYYYKYLFKRALRRLYEGNVDAAIADLKQVILRADSGSILKDDARKTLARLYYEKGEFAKADFLYQQIEMNIVEQAQNLLERAWSHYRIGDPERAMGLLYSFEAPSYTHSFTPEFYILKSFIYKDVCHYKKAMEVIGHFKERYGKAIDAIYQRRPPQENQAMLLVILNKPRIKNRWRFLKLLDKEKLRIENETDAALKAYLEELYTLKIEEAETKFRILILDEYEKMANEMLRFEEEAHLMEYEIGLDMYQRVYDYHLSKEKSEEISSEDERKKAVYQFQGEFWNDELDDYKVVLPNKCENVEEWDIFFK